MWARLNCLYYGCIDLEEILIRIRHVPAPRRNNSSRNCPAETERITERDDPVADLRWLVSKLPIHQTSPPTHLDHREVAHSIGTNHPRFVDVALVSANLDRRASLDVMIASDCVAIGGNEETGSLRCTKP